MIERKAPLLTAFSLFLLGAICAALDTPVTPRQPPLAYLHASSAANLQEILLAPQMRDLELDEFDLSGSLPGLSADIPSWRGVVETLTKAGAVDIWYSLIQKGAALPSAAAGLGWTCPDAPAGGMASPEGLETLGFGSQASRVDDRHAVAVANAESTLDDLFAAGGGSGWLRVLSAIWRDDLGGAGIWLQPRPFIGLASMLTGTDYRFLLSQYNLTIPSGLAAQVYVEDETLGLTAAIDGLFIQPPVFVPEDQVSLTPPSKADISSDRLRLTLASPLPLLEALGVDRSLFAWLNLDPKVVLPRGIAGDVWFDDDGQLRWTVHCLMGDKDRFRKHLRRLKAVLAIISIASRPPITMETIERRDGVEFIHIASGDFSAYASLTEYGVEGKQLMASLSGTMRDLPPAQSIAVSIGRQEPVAAWELSTSMATRVLCANILAEHAFAAGLDIDRDDIAAALPESESGHLMVEGNTVIVSSPRAMVAWLAPVWRDLMEEVRYWPMAVE